MNPSCHWKQDDIGGDSVWETDCGHAFEFNDEGPDRNGFKFCGYCGKTLAEMRTSDEEQKGSPDAAQE